MRKILLLGLVILASWTGFTTHAQASGLETVSLSSGSFYLTKGQTVSYSVDGWRYIKKLIIRSEGYGHDAMMDVLVNGDVKGTIYSPGSDPSYIVTVAEAASSVELRGTRNSMRILEVLAVVSSDYSTAHSGHFHGPELDRLAWNKAMQLASRTISLTNSLENYVMHQEFMTYVLPIKKVAGRTYAVASARGSLSQHVRDSLVALQGQIAFARDFLNSTLERYAAFDIAVELMSVEEEIDQLLQ